MVCSEVSNGSYIWREGTQIDGILGNPPADTLSLLYDPTNPDVAAVMWNDEPGTTHCPEGCPSSVLGHSKGEKCLTMKFNFASLSVQLTPLFFHYKLTQTQICTHADGVC